VSCVNQLQRQLQPVLELTFIRFLPFPWSLSRLGYAHDEDIDSKNDGVVSAQAVTMPQSLVGMSDDEMAKLAKSSLRKTDMLVMVRIFSLPSSSCSSL
jgi:hypothetical protein